MDFYGSQECVEVIQSTEPFIFESIKGALIRDIFITIGRLNDPSRMRNFENISIATIVDKGHTNELITKHKEFSQACAAAEEFRNKRLGHTNLHYLLDPIQNQLDPVTVKEIRDIIRIGKEILDIASEHYRGIEFILRPWDMGDPKEIIRLLKIGLDTNKNIS